MENSLKVPIFFPKSTKSAIIIHLPPCEGKFVESIPLDMQHRLQCMSEHAGMSIRDETEKRRGN